MPSALVAAVLAGTGLGMGLGLANTPGSTADARALLRQVLGATRAAGSARFTYSSVTQSSNPLLRAAATGSGAVDFRRDEVALTVVQHEDRSSDQPSGERHAQPVTVSSEEVRIGRSDYLRLSGLALPAPLRSQAPWAKLSNPSGPGVLGGLGQTLTVQALGLFTPPFAGLHVVRLGQAAIGGRTTEYSLDAACSPVGGPANVTRPRQSTDIWVDSSNRLVQVQSTIREARSSPRAPASYTGHWTTVSTLRFEGFGRPVRIVAPTIQRMGYSSTVVEFATATC